jgi:type VI secretion system protein VasG
MGEITHNLSLHHPKAQYDFSPFILNWLQQATTYLQIETDLVQSGHLLLAIIEHDFLNKLPPSLQKIPSESLRQYLKNTIQETTTVNPFLDEYTIDLNEQQLSESGVIASIKGRDYEINQLINTLSCRNQNCVILTGDAGVGKTTLVESLALRIIKSKVPASLQNVSIRLFNIERYQADKNGTFKRQTKPICQNNSPMILFIDEAETLMEDVAHLLKQTLTHRKLRTIVAITSSAYQKYLEKEPSLIQRFQVIKLNEPSEEVAIIMLRSWVSSLEKHHKVHTTEEALQQAVHLSHRYLSGRQLPEKAMSVLDTACARVSIAQTISPPILEAISQHISCLQEELYLLQREQNPRLDKITNDLSHLQKLQKKVEKRWENEQALVIKVRELEKALETVPDGIDKSKLPKVHSEKVQISNNLRQNNEQITKTGVGTLLRQASSKSSKSSESLKNPLLSPKKGELKAILQVQLSKVKEKLIKIQANHPLVPTHVDKNMIAKVISDWTGISVEKLLTNEIETILTLKEKMAEHIIGQPHAIDSIARRIQTAQIGLDNPNKPRGLFLLIGPSGVGKKETAKSLGELLYGGEHHLVMIKMSIYQEEDSAASFSECLLNAISKDRTFTDAAQHHPYTIILLEDIEKAHPTIIKLFDKGILNNGKGLVVDLRNTLIFFTSQLGTKTLTKLYDSSNFLSSSEQLEEAILPELLKHFQERFLSRLIIVPYYPLGNSEIRHIVTLKLAKLQERFWEKYQARLTYEDSLVDTLVKHGVSSGTHNIEAILTDTLLPALSVEILGCMATGQKFKAVHLEGDAEGNLRYQFDTPKELIEEQPPLIEEAEKVEKQNIQAYDPKELVEELDTLLGWLKFNSA